MHKLESALNAVGLPHCSRDIVKDGPKAAIVEGRTAAPYAAMDQTTMGLEQKPAVQTLINSEIKGDLP
jgi:hypothetical protein